MKRAGAVSVAALVVTVGLAIAGGYQFGLVYLQGLGGEWAGMAIGVACLSVAVSGLRGEAELAGYRAGYRHGRDGEYDRSNDHQ